MATTSSAPFDLLTPRRKIRGISAVLIPFAQDREIAWSEFELHVGRTVEAGLEPAVNMDTGYGHLLSDEDKQQVLERTSAIAGERGFVAGAFVHDQAGASFNQDAYLRQGEQILRHGGVPVIFQSYGLTQQSDEEIVESYRTLGRGLGRYIGFELSTVFAPFGSIYSMEVYRGLLEESACVGAKHSSLDRSLEWERLRLRNELRPEFHVFTGNDLAIDMVMYGSDYLLGLSSFAPDLFGLRDRLWSDGDERFMMLNDMLQYLGFFAFRDPVPAYKHSAAMFLRLREWISTDLTHPESPERPSADKAVLAGILRQLDPYISMLGQSAYELA